MPSAHSSRSMAASRSSHRPKSRAKSANPFLGRGVANRPPWDERTNRKGAEETLMRTASDLTEAAQKPASARALRSTTSLSFAPVGDHASTTLSSKSLPARPSVSAPSASAPARPATGRKAAVRRIRSAAAARTGVYQGDAAAWRRVQERERERVAAYEERRRQRLEQEQMYQDVERNRRALKERAEMMKEQIQMETRLMRVESEMERTERTARAYDFRAERAKREFLEEQLARGKQPSPQELEQVDANRKRFSDFAAALHTTPTFVKKTPLDIVHERERERDLARRREEELADPEHVPVFRPLSRLRSARRRREMSARRPLSSAPRTPGAMSDADDETYGDDASAYVHEDDDESDLSASSSTSSIDPDDRPLHYHISVVDNATPVKAAAQEAKRSLAQDVADDRKRNRSDRVVLKQLREQDRQMQRYYRDKREMLRQRRVRDKATRRELQSVQELEAAEAIQRVYRAKRTREARKQAAARARENLSKERWFPRHHRAAVEIQRVFRGVLTRRRLGEFIAVEAEYGSIDAAIAVLDRELTDARADREREERAATPEKEAASRREEDAAGDHEVPRAVTARERYQAKFQRKLAERELSEDFQRRQMQRLRELRSTRDMMRVVREAQSARVDEQFRPMTSRERVALMSHRRKRMEEQAEVREQRRRAVEEAAMRRCEEIERERERVRLEAEARATVEERVEAARDRKEKSLRMKAEMEQMRRQRRRQDAMAKKELLKMRGSNARRDTARAWAKMEAVLATT